jgi:glycosyltransferase involved in cell wall biosynthesis
MRVDSIVTTLTGRKNETLASLKKLRGHVEYRLILVKNVYNASKARNMGVKQATSDIIAILDDDLKFDPEDFMFLLSRVKKGRCIWAPAAQFMYRSDYVSVGGFEERIFKVYQEDMEFLYRMISKGVEVEFHNRVVHLGGGFSWRKVFLIRFNEPIMDYRYFQRAMLVDLVKGFAVMNPLRFLVNFAFVLGMVYYPFRLIFGRRSEFDAKKRG